MTVLNKKVIAVLLVLTIVFNNISYSQETHSDYTSKVPKYTETAITENSVWQCGYIPAGMTAREYPYVRRDRMLS